MGLKVFLNGSMKDITTLGNPPITFINGEKKRLIKGVTFVNGEKVVLWDTNELQIDYIPGLYELCGFGMTPLCTDVSKIILSNDAGSVTRVNIKNVSNPYVEHSVKMGRATTYSTPDTTSGRMIFNAALNVETSPTQYLLQQLVINPSNMTVTAENPMPLTASVWGRNGGFLTPSKWLGWNNSTGYVSFYLNGVRPAKYGYRWYSGSVSGIRDEDGPFLTKLDDTTFIGTRGAEGVGHLSIYTENNYTDKVDSVSYRNLLLDDTKIVAVGNSGFSIYNTDFMLQHNTSRSDTSHSWILLGRIRTNYYVLDYPSSADSTDQNAYLKIFNMNGTHIEDKILSGLTIHPYNSNSYRSPRAYCIPTVSQTGYLAFRWEPNSIVYTEETLIVRIQGY